jgi:RNA polymerase sigma factor (sigma-70 family)
VGPSNDDEPREIARLAATGDTAATARLVRLVAPEVERVVRGVMGPYAADADDAVQQALIALIHALPAFRGDCAPAGYACSIAFRTALNVRRRARLNAQRRGSFPDDDVAVGPSGGGSEASRRTALIRGLLEEIPAEQAEALALRTMLGWSLDEIAEAGAAPVNTIRSRLRLAKEALRRKIEADPSLAEELGVLP